MKSALKAMVRQLTPPVLISLARRLRRPPKKSPLQAEHERLNCHARQNEMVLRDGLRFKVHPDSRHGFEYFCYLAPDMVAELNCFLAQTDRKSRLLDIGALHGIFSLVFAARSPDRRVVAVDASPIAFARLLYNVHQNRLANITPIECALSDATGDLLMHYEWEHAVAAKTDGAADKLLSVEKQTGDELCRNLAFAPDVMKVDVEGHEIKVLRGLSKTIEQYRPLIFLEVHPARIQEEGDSLVELTDLLAQKGYRASTLHEEMVSWDEFRRLNQDCRVILQPSSGKGG